MYKFMTTHFITDFLINDFDYLFYFKPTSKILKKHVSSYKLSSYIYDIDVSYKNLNQVKFLIFDIVISNGIKKVV